MSEREELARLSDRIAEAVGNGTQESMVVTVDDWRLINGARRALDLLTKSADHTRIFLTTREKMHPTGVSLFDEAVAAGRALAAGYEKRAPGGESAGGGAA